MKILNAKSLYKYLLIIVSFVFFAIAYSCLYFIALIVICAPDTCRLAWMNNTLIAGVSIIVLSLITALLVRRVLFERKRIGLE
jgi:hypothetical protein